MFMKKLFLLFVVMLGFSVALSAQSVSISGKLSSVRDSAGVTVYKVGSMMKTVARGEVVKGEFSLSFEIDEPMFLFMAVPETNGLTVFVQPEDKITVKEKKGKFSFSGKGGERNQLYYDIVAEHPFDIKMSPKESKKVYESRVKMLGKEAKRVSKREAESIMGYTQGEYLQNVFSSYLTSKVFSAGTGVVATPEFTDYNLKFEGTYSMHPKWKDCLDEVMYQKVSAGKIKVDNIHVWLSEYAAEIKNSDLRDKYIYETLKLATMLGDVVYYAEARDAALKLVKSKEVKADILALDADATKVRKRYETVEVGDDVSDYVFHTREGKEVRISDFRGKIVLIDIWSTFCAPCIAEMPFLHKIEVALEGRDLQVISLSADNSAKAWMKFMDDRDINAENQLIMKEHFNNPFFVKIGRSGIPRFVLIDREGKIINYNLCLRPSNPLLKIYLEQLL